MRLQNPHAIGQVYTNKKDKPDRLIGNTKFLITVQFVMMLVLLTWVATDLFLSYGAQDSGIFSTLAPVGDVREVDVLLDEQRRILARFADANAIQKVEDATQLRSMASSATKEIYEEVEDGDFLIELPGNELIIYRPSTQENIYTGANAESILTGLNRDLVKEISAAAAKANLIENKNIDPIISEITNISGLLRNNADFFELAKNGDYIAYFPAEFVTIVYDPLEQKIVQSGTIDYQL